ncbi:MAG: MBL fold metallo-hydrolase, partial [Nitrospira sp.]|nr:MBL fold metallo-hydrolase [Nitrospira sp.]
DVADAGKYAAHFGAQRIIHRADAEAMPDAEWFIDGADDAELSPGFVAIPVPGHTAGSMALLYREKFLFTGDHLWWNPQSKSLGAPTRLVWRKRVLVDSIQKLLNYRFEWVLAGHGDRVRLSGEEMRDHVRALVTRRNQPPAP